MTSATVAALVAAVDTGTIERGRMMNAVDHILTAKHVDLCTPG